MANTVFANKVIEAKAQDLLTTSVNTRSLMTIDTTLAETAGMTKTINTYTYNGQAEELGVGEGNSNRGAISYVGKDYTVKMVQQAFDYKDEDFMKDNTIVDNMLKGANEVMTNKMTSDFYTECAKATLISNLGGVGISYNAVVDAIGLAKLENEADLVLAIPTEWKADIRKDDDYKTARMGEVIYGGQVGSLAGIPVIATNALTDAGYLFTKEAVKLFLKKDVEVEQERDADKRNNAIYLRAAYVCALVDATKIVKIAAE